MNEHRFALLLAAESERALTAEERLEQMTRERDEARADLAFILAEYANERNEELTEDALCLKIAGLTHQRDEARAQLAAIDTGAPCDGHRHCCADRRKLAEELLRVRAERDALRSSLARKIRHCEEITEERDAPKEKPCA